MGKQLLNPIKILLVISLLASLVAGCGGLSVEETFPLESVNKDGPHTSYIYRAAGLTVPEVAGMLAERQKPDQMSKEDAERMFLVYSDEWYHLQKDPANPQDTLIEVDSKEYVRQNYDPSFLQGYILAELIDEIFDLAEKKNYGQYRGYSSKDIYKPKTEYHPPSDQDRKAKPPITVERTGTIIKRGEKTSSTTVGSGGHILKKEPAKATPPSEPGKIIKNGSKSYSGTSSPAPQPAPKFSPPKRAPPKTKVGGVGKITRR